MNKKLSALLGMLCFTSGIYAQIINDFELGTASLTANSAVYKNQSGSQFSIMQCNVSPSVGSVFTPFTAINNYTNKNSIMTWVNEPVLASYLIYMPTVGADGGNYSLRLNNNTSPAHYDITSYTQTFMPTSKYISFDYLAVLDSPHTDPDEANVQPFFTARLLDANDNIIQSLPLCVKAIYDDPILSNNNNSLFYTKGFYCQSLIIPEKYINKENIKIQFVVADCGWGGDTGMVYLDNIRLGDPCEHQQYGMLQLNPLETECNPEKITVTGKYKEPNGTIYVDSTLTVLDSAGNPVAIPSGDIILNNFSGGNFSYTVVFNPPLPQGAYEIKVTAHFKTPSGVSYYIEDISTNEGVDISFQDSSPLNIISTYSSASFISATWEDVGSNYIIEYLSCTSCCPGYYDPSPNQTIYTFTVDDNNLDAVDVQNMINIASSKIFRFRVKTECGKLSDWCCITLYGTESTSCYRLNIPDHPFYECVNEEDLACPSSSSSMVESYYPNPTNSIMTVENSLSTMFEIYDINQKIVKTVMLTKPKKSFQIDLSTLKKGIYILKTNRGQETKIIKQ